MKISAEFIFFNNRLFTFIASSLIIYSHNSFYCEKCRKNFYCFLDWFLNFVFSSSYISLTTNIFVFKLFYDFIIAKRYWRKEKQINRGKKLQAMFCLQLRLNSASTFKARRRRRKAELVLRTQRYIPRWSEIYVSRSS